MSNYFALKFALKNRKYYSNHGGPLCRVWAFSRVEFLTYGVFLDSKGVTAHVLSVAKSSQAPRNRFVIRLTACNSFNERVLKI